MHPLDQHAYVCALSEGASIQPVTGLTSRSPLDSDAKCDTCKLPTHSYAGLTSIFSPGASVGNFFCSSPRYRRLKSTTDEATRNGKDTIITCEKKVEMSCGALKASGLPNAYPQALLVGAERRTRRHDVLLLECGVTCVEVRLAPACAQPVIRILLDL